MKQTESSPPKRVKYGLKVNTKGSRIERVFKPPTFSPDEFEKIAEHLDEHGYVVVNDVLSDSECEHGLKLFWEMMVKLNPNISQNDPKSWTNKQWPGRFSDGITTEHGVGQSEFMWWNRTRPTYIKLFQHLLNEQHLVVSFDGFVAFRSGIPTTNNFWPHIDQNTDLPGSEDKNIQGAINYFDIMEQTGGFCCVPGSHKTWREYVEKYNEGNPPATHGLMIPNSDPRLNGLVKLIVPAKSATLWYAKTIHCSTSSINRLQPCRDKNGTIVLDRLSALVSYAEAKLVTPEILKKKLQAVANGNSTTHWARLCVVQKPSRWGRPRNSDPIHKLPARKLTEEELMLVVPQNL